MQRAALAVGLLAVFVGADGRAAPSLTATARASARPRECAARPHGSAGRWKANVWDAAREPALDRYCDLMAKALGQLAVSPQNARMTADLADAVSPGHAGPAAVRARALVAGGAFALAAREFARAREIDPRSVEDPETMRDWARCLARVGRAKEALDAFRALAPRVGLLPGADQGRTLLEAAEVALSIGPAALDDAIAFLREAKRVSASDGAVLAALALALDRRGMNEEAASVAIEASRRLEQNANSVEDTTGEAIAAVALVSEATDRASAIRGWERYLQGDGAKGPWADHARRRLDALKKQGGKGGVRR